MGDSTRRRTEVNAVIWNLINTKLQKQAPGLSAFPSHPRPLGQQGLLLPWWNMGQFALLAQWDGFSTHISSWVLLLLFKSDVYLRMTLLLEFRRKGIFKKFIHWHKEEKVVFLKIRIMKASCTYLLFSV